VSSLIRVLHLVPLGVSTWLLVSSVAEAAAGRESAPCRADHLAKPAPILRREGGLPILFYVDAGGEELDRRQLSSIEMVPSSAIHLYKKLISRYLGRRCRFRPTCSEFAADALRKKGLLACMVMTADRLTRDHGFIRAGDYAQDHTGMWLDPVEPPRASPQRSPFGERGIYEPAWSKERTRTSAGVL